MIYGNMERINSINIQSMIILNMLLKLDINILLRSITHIIVDLHLECLGDMIRV